jgi:hypothetical protein
MLTFKKFMLESGGGWGGSSKSGTGTGKTSSLNRSMLHNRQAASRMYSPAPFTGGDFGQWFQHRQTNIATVLEFLYHRYESKDLIVINGQYAVAASEIEDWHDATSRYLIKNGVLHPTPAQNVPVRWVTKDLTDSVPSFQHYTAGKGDKTESDHYTTEETLASLGNPQVMQTWIDTNRMSGTTENLPGLVFYVVDTKQILGLMQRQRDIHGGLNLGRELLGVAAGPGTYQPDQNIRPFRQ